MQSRLDRPARKARASLHRAETAPKPDLEVARHRRPQRVIAAKGGTFRARSPGVLLGQVLLAPEREHHLVRVEWKREIGAVETVAERNGSPLVDGQFRVESAEERNVLEEEPLRIGAIVVEAPPKDGR